MLDCRSIVGVVARLLSDSLSHVVDFDCAFTRRLAEKARPPSPSMCSALRVETPLRNLEELSSLWR